MMEIIYSVKKLRTVVIGAVLTLTKYVYLFFRC